MMPSSGTSPVAHYRNRECLPSPKEPPSIKIYFPAIAGMQCEADQSVVIFCSDGDSEESSAISSTLGGGMSASASGEAVDKLSEMFPNESRIETVS